MPWDMNGIVGSHDILMLVLDTLRYDVAEREHRAARTPNFATLLPSGWEKRHTPGSFTYAAHQAFFAGFLPTPADPSADNTRLFAAKFAGSETTGNRTKTFETENWVTGLADEGYHTICIGGVGFFNQQTAVSRVLPGLFHEAHWSAEMGVTNRHSTELQFAKAAERLAALEPDQKSLLFINVSALHQPNYFYCRDQGPDDLESHAAALRYVDSQLPLLTAALQQRQRPVFCLILSDHGTAYGEEGWTGHRLAHPSVWTVPYGETVLTPAKEAA